MSLVATLVFYWWQKSGILGAVHRKCCKTCVKAAGGILPSHVSGIVYFDLDWFWFSVAQSICKTTEWCHQFKRGLNAEWI